MYGRPMRFSQAPNSFYTNILTYSNSQAVPVLANTAWLYGAFRVEEFFSGLPIGRVQSAGRQVRKQSQQDQQRGNSDFNSCLNRYLNSSPNVPATSSTNSCSNNCPDRRNRLQSACRSIIPKPPAIGLWAYLLHVMTAASPSSSRTSACPPQHSAAWALALVYGCLIVYASLYPFAPWSSNGLPWWGFVSYPLPRYWTRFDIAANLLGYMPWGFLVALLALRSQGKVWPHLAVPLGLVAGAFLSFGVEVLQNWLPQRVPSNVDWMLNTAGSTLGALLAWLMGKLGVLNAWSRLQQNWFAPDAQGSLVLLLLWPWALLYPQAVPFGLGQVQEKLENWLGQWLAGTPFAEWLPLRTIEFQPMLPWQITLVVAVGLALPCLLAFDLIPAWRKRLAALIVLLAVGVCASALGNALGLGPAYAWTWLWRPVQAGLLAGGLLALAAVCLPRGLCRWLAIAALAVQLYLINGAAVSAYFGLELEEWLPGRFIRFYGLTQWIGWLWPYAALLYLLAASGAALRRRPRA